MNYSKPFLNQVIFQANFQIDALKDTIIQQVVDICKLKTGAELIIQKNTNINFLPSGAETQISNRWTFMGAELQIVLQSSFLQVITLKYTTHEDYHQIINDVFEKVKTVYSPILTRVALRYINNIKLSEGSTFDFEKLINNNLLNPTLDYKDFGLSRSIGVINMIDKTGEINTQFTYGFVNEQFPSRIVNRHFVLDFDCSINLNTVFESVRPLLLKLRNQVNELFEKSILEDLRTKMKKI